jgi:hypothetical protein
MLDEVTSFVEEKGDANEVRDTQEIKFPVDFSPFKRIKGTPNSKDMPNEELVSDDSTLQEQRQILSELLEQMQEKVDQLKLLIAQNPELATVRMVDFNPTSTVLKSVREAAWSIFNATGKFIGRNSAEAVIADTEHLFRTRHDIFNMAATVTTKGSRDSNIGTWINTCVSPQLDLDMKEYVTPKPNGLIKAMQPYLRFSKNIYKRVLVAYPA